jgi:opacity protein-like surface antigen
MAPRPAAFALLLLLPAGTLAAQSGEFWAEGGASVLADSSIGSPIPGGNSNAVKLDDGFRVSFRFVLNSSGHLGHEFQYAYNRSALSDSTGIVLPQPGSAGMAIHQVGYNLLYYLRPTSDEDRVRPFFTAGVNVDSFSTPATANPRGGSARFGFNYGGGIKYRISQLWAWRWDVRGYDTGKPNWRGVLHNQSGLLQQFEASVGIGVYF